jgi:hypothetical protein
LGQKRRKDVKDGSSGKKARREWKKAEKDRRRQKKKDGKANQLDKSPILYSRNVLWLGSSQ